MGTSTTPTTKSLATEDYDPADFTVDAVISLLDAVKDGTADDPLELRSLAQDLRRIRQHCTYLAQQCDDRAQELEGDIEQDEDA